MPNAKQEDLDRLDKTLSKVERIADGAAARLALQTSHQVGLSNSRRSTVVFLRGEPTAQVAALWATWRRNAGLPPDQRPKERPVPWRSQLGTWLLGYLTNAMGTSMEPAMEATLQELKISLPAALEAAQHRDPAEGDQVWPLCVPLPEF